MTIGYAIARSAAYCAVLRIARQSELNCIAAVD